MPMGQMFFSDDNLSPPTVKIEKIWLTHHTSTFGRKELHVHAKFQINFALGRGCRVIAYFYNSDGYPIWDRNKEYYAENGQVSSGEDFTPPYEYCRYDDFVITIPYKELHTTGCFLKVCVSVITKSDCEFLATSEYAHFYIPY